jgi:adenylate cyclase
MNQRFELSIFTIKVKLIAIISMVIGLSLSGMILLASYFFREDSEKRIQENNLQIVTLLGDKIEKEIFNLASRANTQAILQEQKLEPELKALFQSLFFQDNPSFLFLGVYQKNKNLWEGKFENYNSAGLAERQITETSIKNTIDLRREDWNRCLSGETIVINLSPNLLRPALGIALPFGGDREEKIMVVILDSSDFLKSFDTQGINVNYLVDPDGNILVHPKTDLVLAGTSFQKNPIVSYLLENKNRNGLRAYTDEGKNYLGSFQKLSTAGLGVVATVEEAVAFEEVYKIQNRNIKILIIVLCASILIVFFFSRTITEPTKRLVAATKEIEAGNFQVSIQPESRDEIGLLTNSFIEMGQGLVEREKVKSILGNMIDPIVVEEAMKDMEALKRGSEKKITAFFSDVAGFSTISEQLRSQDLASLLNEYLSAMTIILKDHHGVLDKYIGDAIVGIFNAPVDVANHEMEACLASIEMIQKLEDLRNYWQKNNLYSKEAQSMDARIGLNSGPAKVGFMGTDALASYTMMGDTVNLAARLEAAAKDYGVNILIAESTAKSVQGQLQIRFLDLVRVKGKEEPVRIYELVGKKNEVPTYLQDSIQEYEKGMSFYLKKDFKKAMLSFRKSLDLGKTEKSKKNSKMDKAARLLLDRCEMYSIEPPPKEWDGVFTRTHK